MENLILEDNKNKIETKNLLDSVEYKDTLNLKDRNITGLEDILKIPKSIAIDKINTNKYTITRKVVPLINVPTILVKHNYIINVKDFSNSGVPKREDLKAQEIINDIPTKRYAKATMSMSTEEMVVGFYRAKLYSNGSSGDTNKVSDNLKERLNPEFSDIDSVEDIKEKIAISAVQKFYIKGHRKPKDSKFYKKGEAIIVPSKEIKTTENLSKGLLSKSVFGFSGKDVISIKSNNLLGSNKNGQFVRPYIDLNSGIKNYKILMPEPRDFQLRESLELMTRTYNNKAVECLLRSMPNFSPNMYYGVFSYYNLTESGELFRDFNKISNMIGNDKLGQELPQSLENVLDTYFVRLQSVNVPKASLSKNEISFMGRKVPKIESKFKEEHSATLTFSLDQYGMILRQFNLMSGIFGSSSSDEDTESLYSEFLELEKSGKLYPKTFFPARFFESSNELRGNRLDFTIIYNDYRTHRDFNSEEHYSSFKKEQKYITNEDGLVEDVVHNKVLGSYNSYRAFIFEDVKVLGSSSPINLERDSSKSMNIQIPIIFKRIKTIDANP